MNTVLDETNVKVVGAPKDLTELVRGSEQCLVALLAPMVREHCIILDLHDVHRIDAAGIAALISLYGCAREAGRSFHVCNVTPRVKEILSLVKLDHILLADDVVPAPHSRACFDIAAA